MKQLKKLSLALGLFWLPTGVAGSTIYDNTVPTYATSGSCGDCVLVDDVLIPSSRNPLQLPIAIRSITIGSLGVDQAEFSIYSFSVKSDGTPAPDPVLIDNKVVTLTGAVPVEEVTFGDGLSTLFTVRPDFSAQPGFGLLYLGLKANANWAWADGPDTNLPTAFLYHLDSHAIFLNNSPGPPFPPNVSYYMRLDGTPVPEPTSILLLGTGMAALICARRRPIRSSRPVAWHDIAGSAVVDLQHLEIASKRATDSR